MRARHCDFFSIYSLIKQVGLLRLNERLSVGLICKKENGSQTAVIKEQRLEKLAHGLTHHISFTAVYAFIICC